MEAQRDQHCVQLRSRTTDWPLAANVGEIFVSFPVSDSSNSVQAMRLESMSGAFTKSGRLIVTDVPRVQQYGRVRGNNISSLIGTITHRLRNARMTCDRSCCRGASAQLERGLCTTASAHLVIIWSIHKSIPISVSWLPSHQGVY